MTMRERFERLASASARKPILTLGIVAALALAGGLLALGLQPDAGTDTFVSGSSPSSRATADDHQHFGGDQVVVLIREPLTDLVETKDLATISQLEACLAGQVIVANQSLGSFTPAAPGTQPPYGGQGSPCGRLMRDKPVQVVYGPGTFLNQAVTAVNQQVQGLISSANQAVQRYSQAAYQLALARHLSRKQAQAAAKAAGQLEQQQQLQTLEQTYFQSGLTGLPRIDSTSFIRQVVFDAARGVNQPKARFSYLFPTSGSALIQARLKPGLSSAQQASAIAIPTSSRIPKSRTIGTGESWSTRKPAAVASAAVAIVGAPVAAARAIARSAGIQAPAWARRASSARDWNWIA